MSNYKREQEWVDILQNSSLQNFNSSMHFDQTSNSIDYDFYDSNFSSHVSDSEFEVMNEGIKKIQINPLQKLLTKKSFDDKEINIVGAKVNREHESNLTKCIAYENQSNSSGIECISKSSIEDEPEIPVVSPLESSVSTSTPSSELTNVTPFSTSSSGSSVKGRNNSDDEDGELDMKLLTDAVETLSLQQKNNRSTSHSTKYRTTNRSRRKNMTFTNEELRKIDRENERLLKKIMSYTKPRPKTIALRSNTPPLRIKASAAVNRSKQQRQINHDNFILLKRIHNAKPTQSFSNSS